jgi:outer membrane protein assembly factor BamB
VGDLILFGDDQDKQDKESNLFGIDARTGKIMWHTPRKSVNYSAATPLIFHPKSGADMAIFSSQGDGLTGVDIKTGKVEWQSGRVFDSRTVGSPTTGAGLIFAACGEGPGGHVLVAVKPGEESSAKVAWKTKENVPYVVTPIVKGDLIYYWADRGILTCAKAATGEVVYSEKVPGSYYSSPIIAGNTIFNLTKKGDLVAVAAGEKFSLLGETPFKEKTQATLAISGGRMFLRTYTHVFCIKGTGGQASIDPSK